MNQHPIFKLIKDVANKWPELLAMGDAGPGA